MLSQFTKQIQFREVNQLVNVIQVFTDRAEF